MRTSRVHRTAESRAMRKKTAEMDTDSIVGFRFKGNPAVQTLMIMLDH